jgi:hypothetical protein
MFKFICALTYHPVPNGHIILNSNNPKEKSLGETNNRSGSEENPGLGTRGS